MLTVADVSNIYHVPLMLAAQGAAEIIARRLKLDLQAPAGAALTCWREIAATADSMKDEVRIALVGKYNGLQDSYLSVIKSLQHAAITAGKRLIVDWIDAASLEPGTERDDIATHRGCWETLKAANGVLVRGGFIVAKGGYSYYGDTGWHVVSGISNQGFMGMRAQMSTGAPDKRNAALPRADNAINFTVQAYAPATPGVITTFEYYRPNATNNNSMQLDACLGVTTGTAADECSNPAPGVPPAYSPWFPKIFEDADLGPGSNTASWAPGLALMSQRVFPLGVGGGFYYGGTSGATPMITAAFVGQLFSLAIYRRHLNASERTAVQDYLGARYGLWCADLSPPNAPPAAASGCAGTS